MCLETSDALHYTAGGLWLLLSGTLAGAPAAYLATPLDMLKTRQQADSTDPTIQPVGFRQCLDEVLAEGGWQALFTGAGARVARSAPQFGVTLFVYDQLNGWVQDIIS